MKIEKSAKFDVFHDALELYFKKKTVDRRRFHIVFKDKNKLGECGTSFVISN